MVQVEALQLRVMAPIILKQTYLYDNAVVP